MSVIVRYTAESQAAVNENGRQTEPYRSRWSDCQLTADALRLQKHCVRTKKEFWYRKEFRAGGR